MIVSIHQPNYIPWAGYFNKMKSSDVFVLLDDVMYSKGSVTSRNKIKGPNGETYLTVPVFKGQSLIKELVIDNKIRWSEKHWKSIVGSYKKAIGWEYMGKDLENIYAKPWDSLCELNITLIKLLRKKLGIKTQLILASELEGDFGEKSTRIINICKELGADIYLSGNGAKSYNNEEEFVKAGIKLVYQNFKLPEYHQLWGNYIPNLSTIDLLLNKGDEAGQFI